MEQWIVILLFIISIAASSKKAKKAAEAQQAQQQEESELETALEDILRKAAEGSAKIDVKTPTLAPIPAPSDTSSPQEQAYKPMQVAPEGNKYGKMSVNTYKTTRNAPSRPKKTTQKNAHISTESSENADTAPEIIDARNLIIYEAILNPKHTEY